MNNIESAIAKKMVKLLADERGKIKGDNDVKVDNLLVCFDYEAEIEGYTDEESGSFVIDIAEIKIKDYVAKTEDNDEIEIEIDTNKIEEAVSESL